LTQLFRRKEFDKPSHRNQHEKDAHKKSKGEPAMKEHEFNQMQQAFEESKFYSCGESQADRIANWNVWKDAWKSALTSQEQKQQLIADGLQTEAIRKGAALVRGDGLSVLYKLCDKQKTVSTKIVLDHIERTHQFMKECAATMRQLFDEINKQQAHIGDANKIVVAQPEFERLTEFKASELRKQGYKNIGVVLQNEFNQVGIVAHSSVRWIHTQEDFFDFMHPSEQPVQKPMELEALRKKLETAVSRINDMLESDDGQAHKEARKFIESLPAPENGE
jgi:hypothetical protein